MSTLATRLDYAEEILYGDGDGGGGGRDGDGDGDGGGFDIKVVTVRTILDQETGERREVEVEIPEDQYEMTHEFDAPQGHVRVFKPKPGV